MRKYPILKLLSEFTLFYTKYFYKLVCLVLKFILFTETLFTSWKLSNNAMDAMESMMNSEKALKNIRMLSLESIRIVYFYTIHILYTLNKWNEFSVLSREVIFMFVCSSPLYAYNTIALQSFNLSISNSEYIGYSLFEPFYRLNLLRNKIVPLFPGGLGFMQKVFHKFPYNFKTCT